MVPSYWAAKKVAAGKFKARCLILMEGVRKTREPLLITSAGNHWSKLVPPDDSEPEFIGHLEGAS
jgi:hypothetical protein